MFMCGEIMCCQPQVKPNQPSQIQTQNCSYKCQKHGYRMISNSICNSTHAVITIRGSTRPITGWELHQECDGARKCNYGQYIRAHNETKEGCVIPFTNTIRHPWTVMIMIFHTSIALSTVRSSRWSMDLARCYRMRWKILKQHTYNNTSGPILCHWHWHYDSVVVVAWERMGTLDDVVVADRDQEYFLMDFAHAASATHSYHNRHCQADLNVAVILRHPWMS
jgi:hypothetical protein